MGRVGLKEDGTILLANRVSCDGFACDREVRVQTHIHADHMVDFGTSKANQRILMSTETRELLCAIQNADLPHRSNVQAINYGTPILVEDETLTILSSNHMLGSAQVLVSCADGYRVGYSSDFFWPVEDPISVDELIVDATYGNPNSRREYNPEIVDEKLSHAVLRSVRSGRQTVVIGYAGRLHASMSLLGSIVDVPLVCAPKAYRPIETYRNHGYTIPEAFESSSPDGLSILKTRTPCLAFATFPERRHLPWVDRMAKVSLSAYHTNNADPVLDYGNGDCCVAYTDHADFEGTLEYVSATGAQLVWTDPRTGDAEGLAAAIKQRLGVDARVAERIHKRGWG